MIIGKNPSLLSGVRMVFEKWFQVDYASFHKTFEVNCPENSAMDEQQKKIERERYQFYQLNLPKPKTTSPTESQNQKRIWWFSVQKIL